MRLIWNIFIYDFNKKDINIVNIFEHDRFYADVIKNLKECRDKNEFKEELRRDLMYYFWSKVEYEIFVSEPFPHITKKELDRLNSEEVKHLVNVDLDTGKKLDVYQQIMMNYNHFIEYIWRNKKEILKNEENN